MRLLFSIIAITICALTADAQTFLGNLRQNEQGKGHVTVSQSADIDALVNGTNQQQKQSATTQNVTPQKQTTTTQQSAKEPVHTQLVAPPTQKKTQDASQKEHTQSTATKPQTDKTATKPQTDKPTTKQQVEKPVENEQTEKPAAQKEHEQTTTQKEREQAPVQKERVNPTQKEEEETTVVDTRKKMMSRSYKMQGYRIQVFSGGNSRKDRQKAENAGTKMKSCFPDQPIYVHFYSPSWKCRMGNFKSVSEARRILPKVKKMGYPQACIVKGPISVQY